MPASEPERPWVLMTVRNRVATIVLNRPERYNAWSLEMREAMLDALRRCASDEGVGAAILTGSGKYYCSGVDFAGAMRLSRPSTLQKFAQDSNQALFEAFLDFPKPLFAAVNGPAIGASVTSAALCEAIIAAPAATFHTPFRALGITPEGCSSVNFPRLLGEEHARVMLEEGRKVDAAEALTMGLVKEVVEPPERLLSRAQEVAEEWVAQGRRRRIREDPKWLEDLVRVNKEESAALAASFLKRPFLEAQYQFAAARGKTGPKIVFGVAKTLMPLLSKL